MIAYPVAYAIALHGGRYKNALIAAIVVPFFASYLIRMYAWKALLSDDGMVNSGLRRFGLSDGITFLNTPWAVIGGLVYGFVVFMILPITPPSSGSTCRSSRPARTSTTARSGRSSA